MKFRWETSELQTNATGWGFHLANSTTQEASLAGKFTGGVVETLDHVRKSQWQPAIVQKNVKK